MTKIYFGCDRIPRHWQHYFERCNAIELDLSILDNPPKIETLNRWRVDSPKGFAFILRAHESVEKGLVAAAKTDDHKLSQKARDGWKQTLERAQALAARALLIRTPRAFSPGNGTRAAIRGFAEQFSDDFSRPIIWESQGMWDTESTRELADEIGLTYAYDPFIAVRDEIDLGSGDGAFVLTERAGMRREFDRYDIRGLMDRLGSYNRAYFMLRGRFQWEHAQHFADLLDH